VLHTPFFPFSILFSNAIQQSDTDDLDRLERFAASFKSETTDSDPATHPYRVYELLSQTARLCVESGTRPSHTDRTSPNPSDQTMVDDAIANLAEVSGVEIPARDDDYSSGFDIGDWFQSNQQFMWLLHENIPY
jgi:hypothetical protein